MKKSLEKTSGSRKRLEEILVLIGEMIYLGCRGDWFVANPNRECEYRGDDQCEKLFGYVFFSFS